MLTEAGPSFCLMVGLALCNASLLASAGKSANTVLPIPVPICHCLLELLHLKSAPAQHKCDYVNFGQDITCLIGIMQERVRQLEEVLYK